MRDFVVREAINPDLKAESKEAVIREMTADLRNAGFLKGEAASAVTVTPALPAAAEDIVKAILKRELLGSTGIGRGVAIPHAKHTTIDRLIGTVAISKKGVPFDSLDGEPVYVFVMLISPQDRPGDHLRALENVSRSLRDDSFVKALRQAPTRDAIWDLLGEQE
jgi:PTS system fructose-specific IIA component/PTS system nitrogen regulatory IIA component